MPKHQSGFVPANFNLVGKILLVLGIIFILARTVSYFTNWFNISNNILYLGFASIIVSLYLIFGAGKK